MFGANSYLNRIRRNVLRTLLHHLGEDVSGDLSQIDRNEIKRVLIIRPNSRLGNQLLITPLIQEVERNCPNAEIFVFTRGKKSRVLFKHNKRVVNHFNLPEKPFKSLFEYIAVWLSLRKFHYDLVINVSGSSSSGRLATWFVHSKYKLFSNTVDELQRQYADYGHIAKFPVYNLRKALYDSSVSDLSKNIPTLNITLAPEELERGKQIMDQLVPAHKKTICIFTFATGKKCYSKEWWKEMYRLFCARYGEEYNILEVLPYHKQSQIDYEAPTYYSTDIREICALLSHSVLFFGADSGMMHLAAASNICVVGLFSVTKEDAYAPYGNGSTSINVAHTTCDEVMRRVECLL